MLAGIVAFFTYLPEILTLIAGLGNLFERLIKIAQTNNLNAWRDSLEKQIDALEKAKTPQEKLDAAKGLASIVRGIGS